MGTTMDVFRDGWFPEGYRCKWDTAIDDIPEPGIGPTITWRCGPE